MIESFHRDPERSLAPQALAGRVCTWQRGTAFLFWEPAEPESTILRGHPHHWLQMILGAPSPASELSWAFVLIAVWKFCSVHALKACREFGFLTFSLLTHSGHLIKKIE